MYIGDQCLRNDYCALAVSDEGKKVGLKSYNEKFLSTEFARNKKSLLEAEAVSDVIALLDI